METKQEINEKDAQTPNNKAVVVPRLVLLWRVLQRRLIFMFGFNTGCKILRVIEKRKHKKQCKNGILIKKSVIESEIKRVSGEIDSVFSEELHNRITGNAKSTEEIMAEITRRIS